MPTQEELSQGAMDAMDAALADPAVAPVPAPEVPDTLDESHREPEGEVPSEHGETEEQVPSQDGEKGPEGQRERNPDGTWKKAEPKVEPKVETPKVEPKVEPKVAPKVEPKVEPKAKDPINDPIPPDTKKETSERIRSLIETAKESTAKYEKAQQDFDYMIKGVEATGTSPEQYGETLSWLALFNSRDPAQQEKALELVENVAERLATLLGKERAVGDPLSAHADLKDAVAKNQITLTYAKEIARTRNGQQFRTELTTHANQEGQQREAAAREEHEGRTALMQLEQSLEASDPDYAAKKAILVPALRPVMASVPWSQKAAKFSEAYKNLKLPGATPRAAVPGNQPLRAGKQPAGGQTRAPASMAEAIDAALNGMKK